MTISDEIVVIGNRYYIKATVALRDLERFIESYPVEEVGDNKSQKRDLQ